MTLPKSAQKRPYLEHGHHALTKALRTIGNQDGWVERLGDVGKALKAWKGAIIEDLGGEAAVSAMELSVIELATKTHLLLASVDRFLLEQTSLINKSKRQLFPIVLQRNNSPMPSPGTWASSASRVGRGRPKRCRTISRQGRARRRPLNIRNTRRISNV